MIRIGLIGGSGLEDPRFIEAGAETCPRTAWGEPSSPLLAGTVAGTPVVCLARHGRRHTITPGQVNNRANITALREAGCTHLVATTACGSLRAEIGRGDLVLPDQFIDFTRGRPLTFFDTFAPGQARHTPLADPFDGHLRQVLAAAAADLGLRCHDRGTVITIEGPRFSTRAESRMFRAWGADLINMSTAPEAILAAEAGLPYAAVAMSTDYDCWKTDEPPVSFSEITRVFAENAARVTRLLTAAFPRFGR